MNKEDLIKLPNGLYKDQYTNYLYKEDFYDDFVPVKSPKDGSNLKATEINNVYVSSDNDIEYYVPNEEKVLTLIDKDGNQLSVKMTEIVDGEEVISILVNDEMKEYKLYDLEENLLELVSPINEEELEAIDQETYVDREDNTYTSVGDEILPISDGVVEEQQDITVSEDVNDINVGNDNSQIEEYQKYNQTLEVLNNAKVEESYLVSVFSVSEDQSSCNHQLIQNLNNEETILSNKVFKNDEVFKNNMLIPAVKTFALNNELEANEIKDNGNNMVDYQAMGSNNTGFSIKNIDQELGIAIQYSVSTLKQNEYKPDLRVMSNDNTKDKGRAYVKTMPTNNKEAAFTTSLTMVAIIGIVISLGIIVGLFLAK